MTEQTLITRKTVLFCDKFDDPSITCVTKSKALRNANPLKHFKVSRTCFCPVGDQPWGPLSANQAQSVPESSSPIFFIWALSLEGLTVFVFICFTSLFLCVECSFILREVCSVVLWRLFSSSVLQHVAGSLPFHLSAVLTGLAPRSLHFFLCDLLFPPRLIA